MEITMEINEERNGIEFTFSGIPDPTTRKKLVAHKFRFHGARKVWYVKQTYCSIEEAEALLADLRENAIELKSK